MRDHRRLEAFQKAHALMLVIYRETRGIPEREKFGLVAQMRRSAISVPANLAEGSGRRSTRDFMRFARIALGSLRELEYYIQVCRDLGYWSNEQTRHATSLHRNAAQSLCGLIRSLEQ